MSRKVLRQVRDSLVSLSQNDMFLSEALKGCIAMCNQALQPGKLPPHQVHSETSTAAAIALAPKFGTMTHKVFVNLSQYPNGLTDQQGQKILDMPGDSYRPCRVTLHDQGFVTDSGERRKTARNNEAIVWKITELGLQALEGYEA